MGESTRTTLRISNSLKRDLNKLAFLDNRSLNTLMQIALEEYRDKKFKELGFEISSEDKK